MTHLPGVRSFLVMLSLKIQYLLSVLIPSCCRADGEENRCLCKQPSEHEHMWVSQIKATPKDSMEYFGKQK